MAATNQFANLSSGLESPARHIETVTPNDGADLAQVSRALMVGVAGDVAVVMVDGSTGTLPQLQPGVVYPVQVSRVKSTATTATTIIALS